MKGHGVYTRAALLLLLLLRMTRGAVDHPVDGCGAVEYDDGRECHERRFVLV